MTFFYSGANFDDFYFGDFSVSEKDRVETVPPPAAALWRDRFYRRLRARLRVQQWSGDPPHKWPALQPPKGSLLGKNPPTSKRGKGSYQQSSSYLSRFRF